MEPYPKGPDEGPPTREAGMRLPESYPQPDRPPSPAIPGIGRSEWDDPPREGGASPGASRGGYPARAGGVARRAAGGIRASDQERDAIVQRLQVAFAEGRLDDTEFDERMRAALAARTHGDLDELLTDLPDAMAPAAPRPVAPVAGSGPKPGRYTVAYKRSLRHAGRWRVPGTFRAIVYKGSGVVDLRAAELTEPVTTIIAVAYKSEIEILVPPGIRVEVNGVGAARDDDWDGELPADAPIVHVRAFAYKGLVDTRTTPRR